MQSIRPSIHQKDIEFCKEFLLNNANVQSAARWKVIALMLATSAFGALYRSVAIHVKKYASRSSSTSEVLIYFKELMI